MVAEDLHGALVAPLWAYDSALGRGYLLFSQLDRNRLWRWEEGYGAFTIGKSLYLEHAGCSTRLAVGATDGTPGLGRFDSAETAAAAASSRCAEAGKGVLGLALGLPAEEGSADAGERPLLLVESGNARVAKVEASSGKFVPLIHASEVASSKGSPSTGSGALTGAAVVGADGTLYFGMGADPQELAAWAESSTKGTASDKAAAEVEGQLGEGEEAGAGEETMGVAQVNSPSRPSGWIMALPPLPQSSSEATRNSNAAIAAPKAVRVAAAVHPVGLALNAAGDALLIADANPAQSGGAVWRQHLLPPSSSVTGAARSKKNAPHGRSAHAPRTGSAGAGDGSSSGDEATILARLPEGLTCDRPGGMAVDTHDNVWAACGLSGVVVFNSVGEVRGVINTGGKYTVTGVAFGDDGFLYITAAEGCVLRVKAKAKATLVAN